MFEGRPIAAAPAGVPGGFVAGLSSRHDAAAHALRRAYSTRPQGFAPAELIARLDDAGHGTAPVRPRHFSPADPAADPTAGWDPLDPNPQPAAAPFVDPVETAHAAGYAEGFAAAMAAREAAEADAARDRALIAGLLDALGRGDQIDRAAMATRLRGTVLALVERIVGEVGVSAERLATRIDAATDMLADSGESAIVRLHPDDVALVDGRLPQSMFAVGDAGVARGSFVLEAASTIVEDGPALWLEQLAQAIDRAPMPA